jgi:hypothetical protein
MAGIRNVTQRRECGNSEPTSIMSALPLAGVTVIEVRSKDIVCLSIHRILTTVYAGSLQDWRPVHTQVKSYKTGAQGLYVSTALGR